MNLSAVSLKGWIATVQNFLKETRTEGKKVVWPSRQYIIAATVIILIIVLLTGVFVAVVDLVLGKLFAYLLHTG